MPRTIFENIVIEHYENAVSIGVCQYVPIRFFEILFIESGSGIININGYTMPYGDNQLFIFIPNDQYNFEIETPTTVSAIKFLNTYFTSSVIEEHRPQQKEWFKKIETILHSASRTSYISLQSTTEETTVRSLFTVLCNEYNNKNLQSETILKSTLHSLLHIITRNVSYVDTDSNASKIQEIVNYIHQHIYDADGLSNKKMANEFNVSENYIGQYFKKQMGISLKKYILNYKIKLAETRLKYTDLTFTEIALELGFTDSSHLDKTFLSYKGITPSAFRLEHKN